MLLINFFSPKLDPTSPTPFKSHLSYNFYIFYYFSMACTISDLIYTFSCQHISIYLHVNVAAILRGRKGREHYILLPSFFFWNIFHHVEFPGRIRQNNFFLLSQCIGGSPPIEKISTSICVFNLTFSSYDFIISVSVEEKSRYNINILTHWLVELISIVIWCFDCYHFCLLDEILNFFTTFTQSLRFVQVSSIPFYKWMFVQLFWTSLCQDDSFMQRERFFTRFLCRDNFNLTSCRFG